MKRRSSRPATRRVGRSNLRQRSNGGFKPRAKYLRNARTAAIGLVKDLALVLLGLVACRILESDERIETMGPER